MDTSGAFWTTYQPFYTHYLKLQCIASLNCRQIAQQQNL